MAALYYLGNQLRDVFDFDEDKLEQYEYIGEFQRNGLINKTRVRGSLKAVSGFQRRKWYRDSLKNFKGYFFLKGAKIADAIHFDPQTGDTAVFFINYDNVISPDVPYHIFVAMPFDPQHEDTFDAIQQIVAKLSNKYEELKVFRIDMHAGESIDIPEMIFKYIARSGIIIADLTGASQNVYYELGVADALNKKVIQIARNGEKPRFDVAHKKTILFNSYVDLKQKLERDLLAILKA